MKNKKRPTFCQPRASMPTAPIPTKTHVRIMAISHLGGFFCSFSKSPSFPESFAYCILCGRKDQSIMFGQLKDLYNLRKQAQELQKQLENEKITASSSDNLVTLTINGSHELIEVKINQDSSKEQIANAFRDAYNKAQNDLKSILASKFQGML